MSAPGGNGRTGVCATTVLSTLPENGRPRRTPPGSIVSEHGRVLGSGENRNIRMDERKIWTFPRETAVDIGKRGYDMCVGHGRVDALRAVRNNRIDVYVRIPLFPEYQG